VTRIYIDTSSGTWGPAEEIVEVDIDADDLAFLEDASDSEIIAFGQDRAGRD
jgi:hypothetical protein